jgi:hypothetical protein
MAAVSRRKLKKRGREKRNSSRDTARVTWRIVSFFSLSKTRRTKTPTMGKKVMRVRRGTPARLLMKTAPSK